MMRVDQVCQKDGMETYTEDMNVKFSLDNSDGTAVNFSFASASASLSLPSTASASASRFRFHTSSKLLTKKSDLTLKR